MCECVCLFPWMYISLTTKMRLLLPENIAEFCTSIVPPIHFRAAREDGRRVKQNTTVF